MRKPLLLLWALSLCILIPKTTAFNQDNDLIFEDQPPIAVKKSEGALSSALSWPNKVLSRAKRQLFDWWAPSEKTEEKDSTEPSPVESTHSGFTKESQESTPSRTTRDVGDGTSFDDEDRDKVGSGDVGSGDPDEESRTLFEDTKNKKYINRATFYIQEFWQSLEDNYSEHYNTIKQGIEKGLKELLNKDPSLVSGSHTAHFVAFSKTDEYDLTLVVVDVFSQFSNSDVSSEIENAIKQEVRRSSKIGDIVVRYDQSYPITIRSFGEQDADFELGCENGILCNDPDRKCLPIEFRCDGIPQCPDGYDENDCPVPKATSTTESTVQNLKNKCRADDITPCPGTTEYICAEQICDGRSDCRDGSDESNCTNEAIHCLQTEFMCDIKRCIPSENRCDGIENCRDKTDEQNCPKKENYQPVCPGRIACPSTGVCLSIKLRCDGVEDCPDGTDEEDCPCDPATEWTCDNQQCIDITEKCNGRPDCEDESDERDSLCSDDTCGFRCADSRCITKKFRCDGHNDCLDGSDEKGCIDENCTGHFRCDNGNCILRRFRCDGMVHCNDESDERGCSKGCTSDDFRCLDGTCIPSHKNCNKIPDCPSGEDEQGCEVTDCFSTEFKCKSGGCIVKEYVCDNVTDCKDKSDEEDCPAYCAADDFRCYDDQKCVRKNKICDGIPDCGDRSDEFACKECKKSEFKCGNDRCIPSLLRCNGANDCGDRSDEEDCNNTTIVYTTRRPYRPPTPFPACQSYEFTCRSGNQCIDRSYVCDGEPNCQDGSDEYSCGGAYTRCRPGEFSCRSGDQCVPESAICNKQFECDDRSDEENCISSGGLPQINLVTTPTNLVIKQGEEVVFQCRDTGDGRYPVHWIRGNGKKMPRQSRYSGSRLEIPNIQMGEDGTYICEALNVPPNTPGARVNVFLQVVPYTRPTLAPPRSTCRADEATCFNRQCIKKSQVCDGKNDCADKSDEYRCSSSRTDLCEPNQLRCDNRECIIKSWWCDGQADCVDGSDERNCGQGKNGTCYTWEFECASDSFCIPSAFRCDNSPECQDGSDEIGCYKPRFTPPYLDLRVEVQEGETLILKCSATGVPTPRVTWRLNWRHVPKKCKETSVDGVGTLICPNMRREDAGAYSCEVLQRNQPIFYDHDANVEVISRGHVCRPGTFNALATRQDECLSCFCFGKATECSSADLFVYQLPPPRNDYRLVPVRKINGNYEINMLETSPVQRYVIPGPDGFRISAQSGGRDSEEIYQYYVFPDSYHSNQLNSFGGYIKYKLSTSHEESWKPLLQIPDVLIQGNGKILISKPFIISSRNSIDQEVSIRIFQGEWDLIERGRERTATRADIMTVLENVENILIRTQYYEGPAIQTSITNIQIDSASVANTGQGQAAYVEQCRCPAGYQGQSCEKCAPGYRREGGTLGVCTEQACPRGTYGAPDRGIPCQRCPCPLTSGENQFAQSCRLDSDNQVTCDCPTGYTGRRCERCDYGYIGNPMEPGNYCRREEQCNSAGSRYNTTDSSGRCQCKSLTTGDRCDQCKPNSFFLSGSEQSGCLSCFCMGVTKECRSSDLYRDQIFLNFMRSDHGFRLAPLSDPIAQVEANVEDGQLVFDRFNQEIYYWVLPSTFLEDKVTSYGGDLTYKINYTPAPGGQSSKNNAADVIMNSINGIKLSHFSQQRIDHGREVSVAVPLVETAWQRDDGGDADRETFLMALSDIQSIYIKATYTTNTVKAALISIAMDTATNRNTGRERALAVEECSCPEGYTGTSCEDCAPGFARTDVGFYLGTCERCSCNGHSDECDPITKECIDCRDNTQGPKCEECIDGYRMVNGVCVSEGGRCQCDPRGSTSQECINGRCSCKANVVGDRCNECRRGSFHLSAENELGCTECYCFGQTRECRSGGLVYTPVPITILDDNHGFTLSDGKRALREQLYPNFRMSEIGFRASSRSERRFWSLPSQVTGDQILSYGGELSFTIRFTGNNPTETIKYGDRAVMVTGNGFTIFHPLTVELRPNSAEVIIIKLEERNFRTLSPRSGMRPVSRAQMLDVLARVESILVEAATGPSVEYSYVSDVTLEKATRINLGKPAHNVETCSCPPGFKGTSCQACIDGYYKDYNNKCKPCPCENGGRCQLRPDYTFTCECPSEWAGERCEISASLVSVSLSPAGALRPSVDAKITFHCEFNATYEVFAEMSEIYGGLQGSSGGFGRMKVRHPYEFITSGNKELTVHVTPYLKEIDCTVYNKRNQAVANVKTFINPVQDREGPYEPPQPTPEDIQLEIVEYPPENTVEVGGTIRLECRGNSREGRVNIVWSKSGEPFPQSRATDDRNGLLSIRDAIESDSGTYVCTGHDGYSSHAISITILVVGKQDYAPLISIEPPQISVMENEPIEIVCNTRRGSKATIDWRRVSEDGRPLLLNPQIEIVGGRLSISAARKEDEGFYTCIAKNRVGSTEERVYVEVRSFTNPIEEILLIEPQNLTINSGNTVKITCAISNYDDSIELEWRRDRRNIGLNHRVYQSGPSVILELLDVTPADSGTYICTGMRRSPIPKRIGEGRAYIQVIDSPATKVTIRPERITVNVNEEIRLICQADRAARLTWSKSGSQLPPTAQLSGDQRTLYIPRAQRSHTGIYICNANLYGTESTGTAMVQVEQTIVPAIDITPSGPLTLRLRQSHRIKCKASGYPEPNVYWLRNENQPLPPRFESRDGTLYINDMSLEGEGSYVCVAENRAGRVTGSIYVSLKGRPVIRMNHEGTVVVNSGDQFSLQCTGEGEPTPSVSITKEGRALDAYNAPESLGSASVDIYSISEEDEGEYVCKARNELGEATKSVTVYINGRVPLRPGGDQSPNGPDYPPKNVRVQYLYERTNNSFECKYVEGPDTKIKWVRNDGRPLPPNVIQIDASIHFIDVRPEHEGYYTCQLQSRSGSVLQQKTINFIVKGYKRVRLIPDIQTVRLGGNAIIKCVLEGEPDAKIEWKGVNRDLPDRARVIQNTIYFKDMQEFDEGEYLCIATTRQFTGQSKARVVVRDDSEKPRPIVKVLGDQERKVNEGDSIQVQCSVDRSGETVIWTRENESQLPPNAMADNNILRFDQIRRSDAGTYYCSVLTAQGTTPGRETGWDYVVINVLKRCSVWDKRCPDGECVPFGQNCEPSRYTRMNHDAEPVTIKIEQSIDLVRVGDKVDLTCKTTGVLKEQPRWEILVENEEAKKSTNIIGKVLRIQKVLPSHGGKYRCYATAEDGQEIESVYALVVQGDVENQRKAAKMKRAIVGETVELECDQGLEPPTTFKWIRGQGKAIPNAKNQTLKIEKVSQSDAGEYICVASNSAVKIDFPTFLVVKGTIPRFGQNSYIKLRGLPHSSYLRTELNLMVKPESDGLILYTSDNKSRDFISLGIRNGRPEFRFDVGSGEAVIISNISMPFYEWSNITIKRERREGKMWVNGRGPVVGTSQGRFQGLDLSEPVFLGSVPNFTDIKPAAGFSEGFQGCISHFSISDQPEGLSEQDSLEWNNVKECETCKEDSCQNNGVCQEEPNYRGYKCMCPKGFTGVDCERMGTSCYEGLCGDGECQNHNWSFKCHCKLGTYGENCEHRITVTVPSFKTHSHLSYAIPISGNKFMMEMDIKPKDQQDGIFFYAVGQHPRRDFIALAVRDQFVVLTLSLENEPTVVESQNRVEIGRWTKISIEKKLDRVSLMVDGESSNALVPRNAKALTLNTLYIGGYDRLLFSAHDSVLVKDGFIGCIRNIHVDRRPLGLVQSLTGSSNVEQCHGETGGTHLQQILGGENCPERPCKNGGVCNRQHNRQFCVCNEYFQGDYCEMETPCKMDHFCRPHGECKTFNDGSPNSPGFKCHCHFGYTGTYCNEAVHITNDLEFNKHSYVELPESLLPGNSDRKIVSFMIQTSSPGGLVFWQGREQHTREKEYFSIAVVNGHIETTVHEYSSTMRLKSQHRVDDDHPHNVTIVRYPGELQMSVDGITEATASGEITTSNDSPGNIFIGGIPDIEFNTGGKFEIGFEGCFAALRINGRAPVNFHELQIDARNISPCSSDLLGSYNEIKK